MERLVEEEATHIEGGNKNLVLGGISQGMATALCAMLGGSVRVGGFLGTAGWMPFAEDILSLLSRGSMENKDAVKLVQRDILGLRLSTSCESAVEGLWLRLPVFLGHGIDDGVVEFRLGEQARDVLRGLKMAVEWKSYEGAEEEGHWIKEPEQFDDIVKYLQGIAERSR